MADKDTPLVEYDIGDEVAVPVETLTDEELSVLVAPGSTVMMPFLGALPEAEQPVARRSAYRSLLARGIVDPPTEDALAAARQRGTEELELMVRDDVRSVVALREGARLMVAVARTTSAGQDFWYAHVVDDVVVLEQVSSDGLHRFALSRTSRLSQLVADAAVHPDAGDASGDSVPLSIDDNGVIAPSEELLARLGAEPLRSDVVVRHCTDRDPVMMGIFSGPGGTYLTRAQRDHPVASEPTTAQLARAVLCDSVEDRLAQVVVDG